MSRARPAAAGVAAAALLALSCGPAHAGAWTRDFGSYYAKLGADFYAASVYEGYGAEARAAGSLFARQFSVYGELGVLPVHPLQISLLLPLVVGTRSFEDEAVFGDARARATTTRGGDLRIALQVALLARPALSLGVELKLPTYRNGTVGVEHGVWQRYFPLPGDGQLDLTAWLRFGASVPSTPIWIEAGVGYRGRTEAYVGWEDGPDLVDGVPFRFTLGSKLGPLPLRLAFQLDGLKNVKEEDMTREWLALGGGAMLNLWKGLAVEARVAGEAWADNAPRGISFGFGVSLRRPGDRSPSSKTSPRPSANGSRPRGPARSRCRGSTRCASACAMPSSPRTRWTSVASGTASRSPACGRGRTSWAAPCGRRSSCSPMTRATPSACATRRRLCSGSCWAPAARGARTSPGGRPWPSVRGRGSTSWRARSSSSRTPRPASPANWTSGWRRVRSWPAPASAFSAPARPPARSAR